MFDNFLKCLKEVWFPGKFGTIGFVLKTHRCQICTHSNICITLSLSLSLPLALAKNIRDPFEVFCINEMHVNNIWTDELMLHFHIKHNETNGIKNFSPKKKHRQHKNRKVFMKQVFTINKHSAAPHAEKEIPSTNARLMAYSGRYYSIE